MSNTSLNMDVVIGTEDYSVDMKSGLETLAGISDATRSIAEAILTNKVPQSLNHKRDIRTTLKKTFKGSYGQEFSIDIMDEEHKRKLRKMGRRVFLELMSYFMNESLYSESKPLSVDAHRYLNEMDEAAEELMAKLRRSPMENGHAVPRNFALKVKVRYRQSRDNIETLAEFNENTNKSLVVIRDTVESTICAGISRLNIGTGNGRLVKKGDEDSTAFGFSSSYKEVLYGIKKKLSQNLDSNNGRDREHWDYLDLRVIALRRMDGLIVKYMVLGLLDEN